MMYLAGCAVGPDYQRLATTLPRHYDAAQLSDHTTQAPGLDGAAQRFVMRDLPGDWWTLFRSPGLSTLVSTAIAHNWRLEAARAALSQARELTLAQYGGLLPQVNGTFARTRGDFPLASSGEENQRLAYGYYDAHLTLSYNLDVWGKTRRTVEDQQAQSDYARFSLEATLLTLTGNVVASAINAASLQAQIVEQRKLIDFERHYLATVQSQFALGGANGTDVALQQTQFAQQEALLPNLENQLAQSRHALAADLGVTPAELMLPDLSLGALGLPEVVPVSLPVALLDQRPDIRQSEADLHRATADLGIAIANRLPQFSLQGQIGSQAIQAGELMTPGNGLATLAMQVMGPIFSGGTLLHNQRAAQRVVQEQAALWRDTTVGAVRDVANALEQLRTDAATLAATTEEELAAAHALSLAEAQYRMGGVAYLTVLTAENTYQTAALSLVRARAARLADTSALFVALGGGWWNRRDLPSAPPGVFPSLLPWNKA